MISTTSRLAADVVTQQIVQPALSALCLLMFGIGLAILIEDIGRGRQ